MVDAWIDGELPPDKNADFEQHLAGCRSCSAQAEEWRCLTGLLDAQVPARPSQGLEKRTLALFLKEAGPRGLVYWWASLGWGTRAALASSAIIGLVIGCQLGDGWVGMQEVTRYNISDFLFSAGSLLLSWA